MCEFLSRCTFEIYLWLETCRFVELMWFWEWFYCCIRCLESKFSSTNVNCHMLSSESTNTKQVSQTIAQFWKIEQFIQLFLYHVGPLFKNSKKKTLKNTNSFLISNINRFKYSSEHQFDLSYFIEILFWKKEFLLFMFDKNCHINSNFYFFLKT